MTDLSIELEPLRDDIGALKESMREIHTAIIGDSRLGHKGLVSRTNELESLAKEVETMHYAIEERRNEGDKRAHQRIDEVKVELGEQLRTIEKKVDRMLWTTFGAGLSGLVLGGGGVWAFLRGVGAG